MSLTSFEQELLAFFRANQETGFTINQLATEFKMQGVKKYKKLVKAITFLQHIQEVEMVNGNKFRSVQTSHNLVTGTFRANSKGFGFITYEEGEPDLFVPPTNTGAAMNGDIVEAQIIKQVDPETGKGSEAMVTKVIERVTKQMVGEFFSYNQDEREQTGYLGYIVPQGEYGEEVKIMVLPEGIHPADHTICIIKIKEYPATDNPNLLTGLVSKEIGHRDAPGVDILAILFQFGIPHEFPENVIAEAEAVPQEIDPKDLEGRRDLRNELIITIDGADAKDLDDAISLEKNDDGTFQLGVHIADVSHYVKEGSAIDREAFERGTSVYLTDRVVPMLPQRLSNGICSLHANEDRLTLTCDMKVDTRGEVIDYEIYPSVINSSYRMTYDAVNKMIDGDDVTNREFSEISEMVQEMAELHHILETKRTNRGALNFDAPEAKIIVDEEGHPLDIQLRARYTGERLIESFMLCANETVAYEYTKRQLPFVYRIHEQPKEEKMLRFAEFVTSFGMVLRGNVAQIEPRQLQQALKAVEGEPFEQVVSTMMLRSMQQAKYSDLPAGHYGLAAEDYTHFTSPIRRYPDLMVHRLIHRYLVNQPSAKEIEKLEEKLPGIAEHASKMERRAVDAERETDALKKTEYMMDKVGEQYEGMISSITSFGIFVQLPNTVEGLISLKDLDDDYYEFNPQHMVLIGRNRGNIYRIGQKVTIEVTAVDIDERNIDFKLIKAEPMEGMRPISLPKQKSKKDKNNRPKSKKDFQRATGREKTYSKSKNSKNKASKSSAKKSFKIRKRGR